MECRQISVVSHRRPKLLISVRHSREGIAALRGGADIIDVKEPSQGPLGRASVQAVVSIAECLAGYVGRESQRTDRVPQAIANPLPLSLALGEVTEWLTGEDGWCEEFISSLARVRPGFLKLGLAGIQSSDSAAFRWMEPWQQVRTRIDFTGDWVAVAYADHVRAQSPSVEEVCAAAVETGCRILLIDTFSKDSSGLLDFLTPDQLLAIRANSSAGGLQLALAGQIRPHHLERLLPIGADIIAVRGAVCEGGRRSAEISEQKVRAFLEALDQAAHVVKER